MPVTFHPSCLKGYIELPADPSILTKTILCAALSDAKTKISLSRKMPQAAHAVVNCLHAMGASFNVHNGILSVLPVCQSEQSHTRLNFGQNTDVFDLLLAPTACLRDNVDWSGDISMHRPTQEQINLMQAKGCVFSGGKRPMTISGRLRPGAYRMDPLLPETFLSGLLTALPLLCAESKILTDPAEKTDAHTKITLAIMKKFSVQVTETAYGYSVPGRQQYISPETLFSEANWMNACYFLGANAFGSDVKCVNLNRDSLQPERKVYGIIQNILDTDETVFDCSFFPEALPLLCVTACAAKKTTVLISRGHPSTGRINESLSLLGANIESAQDTLTVNGNGALRGGTTACFGEKHIAMGLAVASLLCQNPVKVTDIEDFDDIWCEFLEDFISLGGKVD